jgi:N6-adenosine-specific RNA methylase IME4
MSIEELCQLPVNALADKDSVLLMWATFPQLSEALRLIQAWGFVYKTVAFVWLKKNKVADSWFYGLGFWTRGNAEICLLATKGKPKRESAGIHQFIISPIEQHSKKPDITRDKIVQLMGDVPRIELFARQVPDGWDVWGNEVPCDILMEGSENNGVCAGSEGLDESQNQGDVQPDKETADLLLSGSGSGTALLPAYERSDRHNNGGNLYDSDHAAILFICHV